jgi:hypothetical protein
MAYLKSAKILHVNDTYIDTHSPTFESARTKQQKAAHIPYLVYTKRTYSINTHNSCS